MIDCITEETPTDADAISRQEVLEGLASIAKAKAKSDTQKSLMGRVMFFVEQFPSVTPQPKMGRWVKTIGENGVTSAIRCSECGFEDNRYELFDYCPVCGAKMQGVEE